MQHYQLADSMSADNSIFSVWTLPNQFAQGSPPEDPVPAPAPTPTSVPTPAPAPAPALKDYIPLPVVTIILGGLITIIWALIIKWKEAEVKKIEAEKTTQLTRIEGEKALEISRLETEISNLKQGQRSELSEKNIRIQILEAEIKNLREVTAIEPLNYLRETKPVLEEMIEKYKGEISQLLEEKGQLSLEKEKLRQELESRLSSFEKNLQQLSVLEQHLLERSASIQKASLWLKQSQSDIAKEACRVAIERLDHYAAMENQNTEKERIQLQQDITIYLKLVSEALKLGRTNLLDKARQKITPVFHPVVYSEIFKVIRDDITPIRLTDSQAVREVNIYFNHLVNMFEAESR
ncbi:MAG: hypothetical protein AB8B99_17930 [Phormidesmis sp.]